MQYTVNDTTISYDARGERRWGDDDVLLKHAIDLTKGTPWHDIGYGIASLFDSTTIKEFHNATRELLISLWRKSGLEVSDTTPLTHYHFFATDITKHLSAVDQTKLLSVKDFPVPITLLERRVSELCKQSVRVLNPFDGESVFHFRVVRPNSRDNNPLHRDVWLEDYDDCINLYIPIAGSNERSSLILLPGSHVWPESTIERTVRGAEINGVRFNVPAVTDINIPFDIVRPNPSTDEVLVFSPYLIHGGAVNLNHDETRISIEIRLWRS